MHIISQKKIVEAKATYPSCASALDGWYRLIKANTFHCFADLKKVFNSIDKVDNFYIFDIGGNKLRIIAAIHFDKQKVFIREILDHKTYDKGLWKQ